MKRVFQQSIAVLLALVVLGSMLPDDWLHELAHEHDHEHPAVSHESSCTIEHDELALEVSACHFSLFHKDDGAHKGCNHKNHVLPTHVDCSWECMYTSSPKYYTEAFLPSPQRPPYNKTTVLSTAFPLLEAAAGTKSARAPPGYQQQSSIA